MTNISAQKLGALGGKAVFEKYGKPHMISIGTRGAEKRWSKGRRKIKKQNG